MNKFIKIEETGRTINIEHLVELGLKEKQVSLGTEYTLFALMLGGIYLTLMQSQVRSQVEMLQGQIESHLLPTCF